MLRTVLLVSLLPLLAAMTLHADTQKNESFQGEVTLKVGYRYLLSLPEGYDADTAKKWPLVLFLHGAGERGSNLETVKVHGPPKLIAAGQKFPAIVVSPQVEANEIWNAHGVKALADELIKTYRIDTDRVYLTGMSMGGLGTWETAMTYPETFAAIAPICGDAGVRWLLNGRLAKTPCWIFHGAKDTVVTPAFSEKMYQALTKAKAPVKITIYPDAQHDSWTATYANPEFWDWLFAQKRGHTP